MSAKNKLKADLILEVSRLQRRIKELETDDPEHPRKLNSDKWRAIAESSPDHIIALATDLTIEDVNHPSPGLATDELIGVSITSFLDDQREEVDNILQEVISTGRAALYETVYHVPNGGVIYYETHALPRKADGKMVGLTLVSRDCTKRKKAELKLKDSEEKYRDLFENVMVGVGISNSEGKVIVTNETMRKLTGFSQEDFGRIQIDEVFLKADDRKEYLEIIKQNGFVENFEVQLKNKAGESFWASLSSNPLLLEDENVSMTIAVDIRERKRIEQTLIVNEQNFRDLVENLKDGVAIADENGFHIFINRKFSEITGYSETELLNMTGWDFSRSEDQGKFEDRMKDRMVGKSIKPVYERVIVKKDGTEIPVEMSTTTTIWQGKKSPMAIVRDITERKLVEMDKDILLHQVQEANDRLKSLSRELITSQEAERKRISQELHDEFGQVLTAIALDLGIIERQLDPELPLEIKKRVADLRLMVDELDQMIGELALDLRPSLIDDLGLLPTLNWYVERFSQRAEIEVEIELIGKEKRLPSEIEIALYRIIQEALTNVAKHANAEKVIMWLDWKPKTITIRIEDDGKGFDINELQNAKVPFQGLGLIGMGDRTALLGGRLDIRSNPGEGTAIEVEIPVMGSEWK